MKTLIVAVIERMPPNEGGTMKVMGMGLPELLIILGVLVVIAAVVVAIVLIVLAASRKGGAAQPLQKAVCPRCGCPNNLGAAFCSSCGTSMVPPAPMQAPTPGVAPAQVVPSSDAGPRCSRCGAPMAKGDTFCMSCGAPIGNGAGEGEDPIRTA